MLQFFSCCCDVFIMIDIKVQTDIQINKRSLIHLLEAMSLVNKTININILLLHSSKCCLRFVIWFKVVNLKQIKC